jgi:hypothetical protein
LAGHAPVVLAPGARARHRGLRTLIADGVLDDDAAARWAAAEIFLNQDGGLAAPPVEPRTPYLEVGDGRAGAGPETEERKKRPAPREPMQGGSDQQASATTWLSARSPPSTPATAAGSRC